MLTKLINGVGTVVKTVWKIGVSIPSKYYEWAAVILIVVGVLGLVFGS